MKTEEIIVELILGMFLIFISYQIGIKGNITLLHSYHYTNLDPKDKKIFTRRIGIGSLFVGVGVFIMPIINSIFHSELGYSIGLTMIIIGVVLLLFFIIKYNGNLISFKK